MTMTERTHEVQTWDLKAMEDEYELLTRKELVDDGYDHYLFIPKNLDKADRWLVMEVCEVEFEGWRAEISALIKAEGLEDIQAMMYQVVVCEETDEHGQTYNMIEVIRGATKDIDGMATIEMAA